jgi:hypothetical protein
MYCKLILFYVKQLDQLMEKGLADEEMVKRHQLMEDWNRGSADKEIV